MAPAAGRMRCVPNPSSALPKRLVASRAARARVRALVPAWPLAAATTSSDVMLRADRKAARRTQKLRQTLRCCRRNGTRNSARRTQAAQNAALLPAQWNTTKVRPVNRLVPCCTVQLVPSSSRLQETPGFRLSPPCRPANDSAALLFHRADSFRYQV